MISQRPHPVLRLVMRLDQFGSCWFIPLSLLSAPFLVVFDPPRPVVIAIVSGLVFVAIWLAVLGVLMAWGLTLAMARGDELPDRWWETMLYFDPEPDQEAGAGSGAA